MQSTLRAIDYATHIRFGDGTVVAGSRRFRLPPKELELCATICLNGRPMPLEAILEALWPESETSRARASFKVHVHRIRARCGSRETLVASAERWDLGPAVETDLGEWRRLAKRCGPIPAMEPQRTALMRAFEDILAGPAPSLARSQIGMRLDMAFLDLLEQIGGTLIDDTLARGDAARAAILARSAIAVDPYRERWHEALIRAHLQRGEVAAAHSSLSHYQTTLRSELGIPAPKAIEALVATATAG